MESVVEDSVASVPLSELARIQERLLQEPEVGGVAIMHSGGAAPTTSASDNRDASADVAASIPESANGYRTPNPSPKAPRIATSKSASAVEMEVMINPSPSQEAFKTLTRASSFHGYPCGDTQPMESQVYRDFNESRVKSATTTPKKGAQHTLLDEADHTEDTATDKTPKTCVEGETGYIDLSGIIQSPGARSVLSDMGDLLTSPQMHPQLGESVPKTPNLAGHKRKRSGEILTSVTTNREQSGYSQFFGQNVPMMTTTQLFNQTQAPSSPVPDGPRSDPVITRPSPILHQQFSLSSPSMPVSSPFVSMRPATAGGPRDHYTTVFESQQQRDKSRWSVELGAVPDFDDTILLEDEEEIDPERQRFDYKRMRDAKSEQTMQEFGRFRARSRLASRPISSPRDAVPIDLRTPAAEKTGDAFDFEPSEDGEQIDADDQSNAYDDTELEHGDYANSENDQYDEFGQTVLRSQGPEAGDSDDEHAGDDRARTHDDEEEAVAPLKTVSSIVQPMEHAEREKDTAQPQSTTQDIAIADSQPIREKQGVPEPAQFVATAHPMSSFVPGSQHAGTTSVEQAQNAAVSLNRVVLSSNQQVPGDLVSSPTLPVASSVLPRNSRESLATKLDESNQAGDPTIPESDLPDLDTHRDDSSLQATAEGRKENASNDVNIFSTAATHLSEVRLSPRKRPKQISPHKLLASQQSNAASQSPLKAAGVRHFADIAAQRSLSRCESRETDIDLDAVMKDLISEEDRGYIEAVSSPPAKRRKLGRESSANVSSSPKKGDKVKQFSAIAANGSDIEVDITAARKGIADARTQERSSSALQESTSKANEMPLASQDSVAEREEAGAKAVSQLVSKRSAKTSSAKPGDGKPSAKRFRLKALKRTQPTEIDQQQEDHTDAANVVPEVERANTNIEEATGALPNQTETTSTPPSTVSAPDRIFALFKGTYNKFYPAIRLSSTADGSAYHVKFNDAAPVLIEAQHVRKLELRIGDLIKVDLKEMRSQTWIVKGFENIAMSGSEPTANTDVFCHGTLKVEAKSSRSSLPKNGVTTSESNEVVEVPVSSIYITHTLWPQFADRLFNPPTGHSAIATKVATPFSSMHTDKSELSTTKARRTIVPTAKAADTRALNLGADVASAVTAQSMLGMFAGMVFALSYGQNGGEKEEVARLIRRNGGVLVEHGFDELFDLPSLDDVNLTISSNIASDQDGNGQLQDAALQLRAAYAAAGFVALIADKHSRRAKYVQALALNLPTLSGKWIMDSLDSSKNQTLSMAQASPLPWCKYLLAAGESLYLNGAIRSRTMLAYPCEETKLHETINDREVLLSGEGVLIVTPKKGKANLERSKTYAFLTLALGASNVKRVADLHDAKALISEQPETWKWIYVDGSVEEAGEVLFGKPKGAAKKRKRDDESAKSDLEKMCVGDGKIKVVNDEFVIQSLILGALVD